MKRSTAARTYSEKKWNSLPLRPPVETNWFYDETVDQNLLQPASQPARQPAAYRVKAYKDTTPPPQQVTPGDK